MGKILVIKGADFSAVAISKAVMLKTLVKHGFNSGASSAANSITTRSPRSVLLASVSVSNPVCPTKQTSIDGVTWSAVYIPSWASTFAYSVNSGFLSVPTVYDGTSYSVKVYEPSSWLQSNSFDVTPYRGMWVAISAKKSNDSDFTTETAEDIGFNISFT